MANYQNKRSPAEEALTKAQTDALGQEQELKQRQLIQEAALARAKMAQDAGIERGKLGLGQEELGQKDRQGNVAAGIETLGLGSKERIAHDTTSAALMGDIFSHRGDIPAKDVGEALAWEGHPGLYNTNAKATAAARENVINSNIPQLVGAKSDEERNTKIRPLMAAYPGAFEEALGRAFPKPGFTATTSKPELWHGDTPANSGVDAYGALATALLSKGGAGGGGGGGGDPRAGGLPIAPNGFPILPNTPEPRYVPLGEKPLFGSTRTDGGIKTPSGGFIGGNFSDEQLSKLTGHPVSNPSVATTEPQFNAATAGTAFSGLPQNNAAANPAQGGFQQPTAAFAPSATPTAIPTPGQDQRNLTQSTQPGLDAAIGKFLTPPPGSGFETLANMFKSRQNPVAVR